MSKLRIGLIGAGANTRLRHIPGFLALENVELAAVCNRRRESSEAIAREFNVPRVYQHWQEVIADPDIDAVALGTWPYLHCAVTLAALKAGKHILTEARMSMNAREAHQMLAAAREHPSLVTQIVPSPFGLKGTHTVAELIAAGYLGELREVHLQGMNAALADVDAPLSWRQDMSLSGFNMLTLGILHETLLRWLPPPVSVLSQVHAHIGTRIDPQSGVRRPVGTPDSVQVLATLENGARASYHLSGVTPFGQSFGVQLFGSGGVLHYDFLNDRLFGASHQDGKKTANFSDLTEIHIPEEKALGWRVEAEFVEAIRNGTPVRFTDFETGVSYMEFTEAVARSAETGEVVYLPLEEFD